MQTPAATRRTLLPDTQTLSFLIVTFFTGLAGALQTPTLSLFLSTEVHARPFMVGLFFTVNAVVGIVVGQLLAHYSDRKGDRKTLILLCCLLGAVGSLLFAWNRNYFVLMVVGVFLASFGSSATSQLFALAREQADKTGRENTLFNSVMRAQISLAWIFGPPLAFSLALGYGFSAMYVCAAVAFVVCAVIVHYMLPSMRKTTVVTASAPLEAPRRNRRATLVLFLASTLMWSSNGLYLIVMPLYVVSELHLPEKLAGIMMGLAAGLEIPVMLLAGLVAKRFGKRLLMLVAASAGVLFYLGTLLFQSELAMLLLQIPNAIFIGVIAAIGMIYFQDLMPGQAGAATTLFTNSTKMGWIVGGSLAGLVAEVWSYHTVFWFAVVMMVIAVIGLLRVPEPSVQQRAPGES